MFQFLLPDLGEGISEAEIIKWHVNPGEDAVENEPLVDVETDKATVTIPSPRGGRVAEVAGKPGDIVRVGEALAVIDDGAGTAAPSVGPVPMAPADGNRKAVSSAGPVPAAPATRRLARELSVDINLVPGSGPAGRVLPEDVRRFGNGLSEPAEPAAEDIRETVEGDAREAVGIPLFQLDPLPDFSRWGPVERQPFMSVRRKVARKMVTATVVVPHVSHMDEADVTELEELRKRYSGRPGDGRGGRLSPLAFVVKAVVAALRKHPEFNCSLDASNEEIIHKGYFNIGIAADTGRGLVVPVLRHAGRLSVKEIAEGIQDLAGRAREEKLQVEELQGGTFTITNIGALGGIPVNPVVNFPEVAILGLGRITDKPVVRDDEIVPRKILPLTMSFDHRVADGADAARFVSLLVRLLSDPQTLLVEG